VPSTRDCSAIVLPVFGKVSTSVTEEQLWNWMMAGKYPPGYPDMDRPELETLHRRAYATLASDVQYEATVKRKVMIPALRRKGKTERKVTKTLHKGRRVNVVMASRMGDVGITGNLGAEYGYVVRVQCVESEMDVYGDGRMMVPLKPQGYLIDIEPIEDPRTDKVEIAFPEEKACHPPE
jgi:hypothetical protein